MHRALSRVRMLLITVTFTYPAIRASSSSFIGLPGADLSRYPTSAWQNLVEVNCGQAHSFKTGRAEHLLPVCRSGTTPSPFVPLPNPQQGRPTAIVFFAHLADRSFQFSAKADAGEFQILMDFAFEKGSLVILRLSPPTANGLELEFAASIGVEHVAEKGHELPQFAKIIINKL